MKWVPISYCQFVIGNNCSGAASLFLYMKYHSEGIAEKDLLKNAQRYFDVSDKTIRRWMKQANYYNWIGKNEDTGVIFIRGWQYLFDTLHFRKKTCFRFRKKDMKDFKTYCYAAVMCYMARVQTKELERISGRSFQAPVWIPLASSAIARTLNVSQKTAQTYRQKAVDAGYIKKKHNLKPFHLNVHEIGHFRKFSPSEDKHLVIRGSKVYEQLPDEIRFSRNLIHSVRRFKKIYRVPRIVCM